MPLLIAVDGPAASGKGTVAQALADAFSVPYLDTGLLYRAVGAAVLAAGDSLDDEAKAAIAAERLSADDLENDALRTRQAGDAASQVAAHPSVRAALLDFQRRFAADPRGAVLDGRDIGTVIAPEANAKLFVTARPEIRAERRWRQLTARVEQVALTDILDDIVRRDERDAGRGAAPMLMAEDAVLLDTSEMSISHAVDAARRIVETARARWEASKG